MCLLCLLIVIGLDDVADYRAGGFAAVLAAFLDEHGDADFRIAFWRVADKPGVVLERFILILARASSGVVTNDLLCRTCR